MAGEIVKYANQFNRVALRGFRARELDLLMAISSRVREKGTEEVLFTFDQLRELAKEDKHSTDAEFVQSVKQVNSNLLKLNFCFEDDRYVEQFSLFDTFTIDKEEKTLKVAVHRRFAFLLNELDKEFTRFELAQFASLRSTYAKECYRRLKQYRTTGVWRVSLEEFRRLLNVPETYHIGHIDKKVLTPIKNELGPLIGLRVRRMFEKKPGQPGRPKIVGFTFSFDTEMVPEGDRKPKQVVKDLPEDLELLAAELESDYVGRHVRLSDGADDTASTYKITAVGYYGPIGVAITVEHSDSKKSKSYAFNEQAHINNWLAKNLVS